VRVLVCGGRDFDNVIWLRERLEDVHLRQGNITVLIHGGATGADALAAAWARARDISIRVYRADWARHGKAAGPIRNTKMLVDGKPDLVVAFPGGRGTADMVRQARTAGVRVIMAAGRER
jgi:hypothetical protein